MDTYPGSAKQKLSDKIVEKIKWLRPNYLFAYAVLFVGGVLVGAGIVGAILASVRAKQQPSQTGAPISNISAIRFQIARTTPIVYVPLSTGMKSSSVAIQDVVARMNLSADPCTEFYNLACGRYKDTQNISQLIAGKTSYSITQFYMAQRVVDAQLHDILERQLPAARKQPPLQEKLPRLKAKMRAFYQSCKDRRQVGQDGMTKLRQTVADLGGFAVANSQISKDWTLTELIAKIHSKYTYRGFFETQISRNPWNISENIIRIQPTSELTLLNGAVPFSQGESLESLNIVGPDDGFLGNKVEDRALKRRKRAAMNTTSTEHIRECNLMRSLAIFSNLPGAVTLSDLDLDNIIQLQQEMASLYKQGQGTRSSPVTLKQFQDSVKFIDWKKYISFRLSYAMMEVPLNFSIDSVKVVVGNRDVVLKTSALITNYTSTLNGRRIVHNYAVFRALVHYYSDIVTDVADYYNEQFANTAIKWASKDARVKCYNYMHANFIIPLSAIFVDLNLLEITEKIKQVDILLEGVTTSYRDSISGSKWLNLEAINALIEKLQAIRFNVGFAKWLLDEDFMIRHFFGFHVAEQSYVENMFKIGAFVNALTFRSLANGEPIHDALIYGHGTPVAVNADNMRLLNRITIDAALIMAEPFFTATSDANLSLALNYGAVASVLGHEIGHSFDKGGYSFDKVGNLNASWFPKNATSGLETVESHFKCFSTQYETTPLNGRRVNPTLTRDENLADNAGIQAAFQAFRRLKLEFVRKLDNYSAFDANQLFFIANAQLYCSVISPSSLDSALKTNVHSPGAWRATFPVLNVPEFYEAFNCPVKTDTCSFW